MQNSRTPCYNLAIPLGDNFIETGCGTMSMEARATFMHSLEQRLSSLLTANDMKQVMAEVADNMDGFELDACQGAVEEHDDLLDAYLAAMEVQGRSPKTIERYRYIIRKMMDAVQVSTRQITVYHLRRYLANEKARGISDATLDGVRQVFSAYFNWLQKETLIQANPTTNLGAIRCPKKIKEVYSDVDLARLTMNAKTLRDRAIISFLGATGCRINEVVQLNRDDVNFGRLECIVLGKGNKERTVYLTEVAAMLLQEYLDQRTDSLPALFIGKGTERMHAGGVRAMLRRTAGVAGVAHVHPHKFRRTLATNLIRRGMPIQEVANILGHDRLDTTMKYVVLNQADVAHAYQKYA